MIYTYRQIFKKTYNKLQIIYQVIKMSTLHIIYITNKDGQAISVQDNFYDPYLSHDNFITGLNKNIWGFSFPFDKYDINKIKVDDYILFIKGLKGVSRGKNENSIEKILYKQLVITKATTSIQHESSPQNVWINEYSSEMSYPNRFHFEILGSYPKLQKDIHQHYVISKKLNNLHDRNESKIYTRAFLLLMSWVGANAVIENVQVNLDNIHNFNDINQIFNLDNAILISTPNLKNNNKKAKTSISKTIRKKQSKETTKFYEERLKEILEGLLNSRNEVPINILARIGQGKFRDDLFKFYNGKCLITGISVPAMLTASHIKPWSESREDASCRDPANGILLSANIDRLFDRRLISINPTTLLIETCDDIEVQELMTPYLGMKLEFPFREKNHGMFDKTIDYLRYHYSKFCELKNFNDRESGKITTGPN